MISEDNLATCSFQALEYPTIWNHDACGAGKFVLVGSTSLVALSTDNCKTWTVSSSEVNSLSKIAYGNGKFVAIGNNVAICSTDTKTWIKKELIGFTANQIVYVNDLSVITCNDGYIMTSTDGITWSGLIQIKDKSGAPITNHLYGIVAIP